MNYENIPQLIKDTGQFCTWKYEQRKERMTKVPYNPVTGQKASVDKPETFVDFKTAVKAANTHSGIGIRVTGQIIAIDLDHCIEDHVLLPWTSEIVEHFRDTYIEISPSGTGLRILVLMPDGYVYDITCINSSGRDAQFLRGFVSTNFLCQLYSLRFEFLIISFL